MRRVSYRAIAAGATLLLMATGCGDSNSASTTEPEASTAPTTTLAAATGDDQNYKLVDGGPAGFTIEIPVSWIVLDPSAGTVDAIIAEAEDLGVYDELPEGIRDQVTALTQETGFALYAMALDGSPNLNIVLGPRGPLDNLETMEQMAPQVHEMMGMQECTYDQVQLPAGEAWFAHCLYPVGEMMTTMDQYFVIGEDEVAVVSCSDLPDSYEVETCGTILQSLRFTATPAVETGADEAVKLVDSDAGFTVEIPASWITLDLDAAGGFEGFDQVLQTGTGFYLVRHATLSTPGEIPQDVKDDAAAGAQTAGIDVYALAPSGTPNLLIVFGPRGPTDTLDSMEQANPQVFEMMGLMECTSERVELPAGEALFSNCFQPVGGWMTIMDQYAVFTEDTIALATCFDFRGDYQVETCQTILQSLRFTD